ncbi:MAG: energy transducer TonB [Spirochaetes bacterium]|nr:energy transducer TonB [Spirochaetota bacterium]
MKRFTLSLCLSATVHLLLFCAAMWYTQHIKNVSFTVKKGISRQEVTVTLAANTNSENRKNFLTDFNHEKKPRDSFLTALAPDINSKPEDRIKRTWQSNNEKNKRQTKQQKNIAALSSIATNLARNNPPEYPYNARKFKQQGRVVLKIEITTSGRSGKVTVKESSGNALLDRAAVAGAQSWHFFDADNPLISSPVTLSQAIVFKLSD